jgi:hypothetical protein
VQHPAIHPLLAPYDLGSSDREGTHSLILDRTERTLYVAQRREAQHFLAQQWPKTEPVHMTPKEWKEWTEQSWPNDVSPNSNLSVAGVAHQRHAGVSPAADDELTGRAAGFDSAACIVVA